MLRKCSIVSTESTTENTIVEKICELRASLSHTISRIDQTNILFSKISSPKFVRVIITLKNAVLSMENLSGNPSGNRLLLTRCAFTVWCW